MERSGALGGLRVVDLGQYLAGPLAAMVLADMGADVVRVDPPGGPRWRHPANAILQRGKRSIVLDCKDGADRDVARELIARADVVIEGFRPGVAERLGVGPKAMTARHPWLVYCSIPGFGEDDPRAGLQAWEGVVAAAAGCYVFRGTTPMNYVGDRSRPPVFSAIPQPSSFGAMVALHSIMAALIAREQSGLGQWIEAPLFDATFELTGSNAPKMPGGPPPKPPFSGTPPQLERYRCADGKWLELCLFQDRHLAWFAEHFMPQEWIDDGMADMDRMLFDEDLKVRAAQRFAELLRTKPAREWEIAINDVSGASAALCADPEDWLREDGHARANEQVIELEDPELGATAQAGYPVGLSVTPPRAAGARRPLDADREAILAELRSAPAPDVPGATGADPSRRPLAGIRILDCSQVLAGPTVGRILAEYGADVVKIHSFEDRQLGMHLYTNSGKRSVMLNVKTPEGRALFERLSEGTDVFVQNFTRGVADRIGMGEAELRGRNPGLLYVSVSAFGHRGYRGGWRGREQLGQGVTGMQARYGGYGDKPLMAPFPYCDYGTGNLAAFATLVALYHRMAGGPGQHIHASLAHTGTFLQVPYMIAYEGATWEEPSGQDALGWGPLDRLYRAADGWFYLAAIGADAAGRLAGVEGIDGIDEASLEASFARAPREDWVRRLVDAGVPAQPLLDFDEVMERPEVRARGLSITREHPGIGPVRLGGPSRRLSRTPARPGAPVGPPGADTRAVIEALDPGVDFDELVARDVVRDGLPKGTQFVGMFR
jgi:crotonobetainyl-CoA:carnitine CoA-transferase CaiB-like acyl-CoA transferase